MIEIRSLVARTGAQNAKAASAKLLNRGLVENCLCLDQLIHKTGAACSNMHNTRSG